MRSRGSDRRSSATCTWRNEPRNAAVMLGRAGCPALETAVDPALVAPAVASAAPSLVMAACSARVRRRASVRSVRLARANGLLLSDGPGAGSAQRPLHG